MKSVKELTVEELQHREAVKGFKPKNRQFILLKKGAPVTWSIPNRHTRFKPLLWFDYTYDTPKEIRYCTNQSSVFTDEQKGVPLLGDIVFINGVLYVPKENIALQKLLLFYHPDRGLIFEEFDPEKKAIAELSSLEEEVKVQNRVLDMDIVDLEAVARVALGSQVDNMKSSSIKRDMIIWAKNNPREFNRLAEDKDIQLRNLAQRAIDYNILGVRDSGTTVYFVETDEVILKIPFGENVILNLASYLQTDEGIKLMDRIAMKLQD